MLERTSQNLSYLNSRNAWIRMSSSVNVDGKNDLAKKYILQGGTLNSDGTKKTGLGDFNNAYSNTSSNGKPYRFGIRPMPGITSVDIKSKTAYGSLREAIVSFQCWDIQQLEDLEVLYMRPGYTVLLEWGWTPYLTSDKKYYNPTFNDYYDIINKPQTNRTELFKDLFDRSKKYEGNYDAMFGYVKNYQWSARMDGGYDCQTTIITTGEIIESLKINYLRPDKVETVDQGLLNSEFKAGTSSTEWIKAYEKNILAGMWAELYYRMKESIGNWNYAGYKTGDNSSYLSSNSDDTNGLSSANGIQIYILLSEVFMLLNKYIIAKSQTDNQVLVELSTKYRDPDTRVEEDLLCVAHPLQLSVDPGVCLIKNQLWGDGTVIDSVKTVPNNDPNYQKAKDAFELIKKGWEGGYIDGTDETALEQGFALITSAEIFSAVETLIQEDGSSDYKSLQDILRGELYIKDADTMKNIEISLKKIQWGVQWKYPGIIEIDYSSVDPDTIILTPPTNYNPTAIASSEAIIEKKSASALANLGYMANLSAEFFVDGNPYSELGIVKNIYVNVDYLYLKALNASLESSDDKGKNEINLYNYVKTLMSDIQSAIGNVNSFEIHVDPIDNNVARVIDVNYTEQKKANYYQLFKLNTHELSSIVRSYSLQSQIFPNQSSIIAIGSQVKGGQLGMQSNTMIDFNRNLTDRIIVAKVDGINSKLSATGSNATVTNGLAQIINAYSYKATPLDPTTNPSYDDEISTAKNGLRDTIVYFQSITKSPGSNRNLIPTKFSCEIDGIGGLIIGNMFRLPDHLLPKGYRGEGVGSKLGNAVTGISHTISKGDWVTRIESLNIVLEDPQSSVKMSDLDLTSIITTGDVSDATKKAIENNDNVGVLPPARGGNKDAMIQATNAVFGNSNGASGECAYYTYNIARDYIAAAQGKPTKGNVEGSGGNAGTKAYRNKLEALGYKKTFLGSISRTELETLINSPDWGYGDIINYRSINKPVPSAPGVFNNCFHNSANSSFCYGHTQIFTNGVQPRGGGIRFTSSVPANYSTSLVYKGAGPWETYVFRAPV